MIDLKYILINSNQEEMELEMLLEHPTNKHFINYDIIKYTTDAGFTLNQQGYIFEPHNINMKMKNITYEQHQKIMNFIDTTDIMIFSKLLPNGETYNKRVIFKNQEEERVEDSILYNYNVTFTALSNWFSQIIIKEIKEKLGNTTYPINYNFVYSSNQTTILEFTNTENVVSPLDIQIFGNAINPTYTLFDGLGNVLKSGKFTISILEKQRLEINSRRGTTEIIDDNGLKTNVYALQDFTKETFLFIPGAGTYQFVISHTGAGELKAILRYTKTRYLI